MTHTLNLRFLLTRLLLIVTILGGLTACRVGRGGTSDVAIDLTMPAAELAPPTTLTATLRDASGTPIEGADVTLRGDMTHAGMEPVIVPMQSVGGGQYRTDQFAFNMAGDWILTVEAALPDGAKAEESFPVANVE